MKYLEKLIDTALVSQTNISIEASGQGLSVTIVTQAGLEEAIVSKSTSFWIDKNEKDMEGKMDHFLKLLRES